MAPSRHWSGLIWGLIFAVLGTGQGGAATAEATQAAPGQSGRALKFETYQDSGKEYRHSSPNTTANLEAISRFGLER